MKCFASEFLRVRYRQKMFTFTLPYHSFDDIFKVLKDLDLVFCRRPLIFISFRSYIISSNYRVFDDKYMLKIQTDMYKQFQVMKIS